MEDITFTLPHPCTININGSTGVGKTFLTFDIIKKRKELFSEPIDAVTYVYSEFQPKFYELGDDVTFTNDLYDIAKIQNGPHLIILDDIQVDLASDKQKREFVTNLFLRGSHHRSISVILICQNPFTKGLRDINLNTQCLILYDYVRDRSVMSHIARQVCPGKSKFLQDAYIDAVTRSEYGYLVMTFHPQLKKFKYWVKNSLFLTPETVVYAE